MRSLKFAVALIVGSFATSALAQQTLDQPLDEPQDYHLDSGLLNNPAIDAQTVFNNVVTIKNAAWLRIYFSDVQLEADSFVRITSQLDKEVQELDADALAMWGNSSAYFNGNSLLVELVAAPGTTNRFVINQIAMETEVALPTGTCGICGPDNRVQSDVNWACRLLPAGCTASIWNNLSCLVSAGHCMGGNMVIEFNVPNSNPNNCNINHPPVADQFPITEFLFTNGGTGNDWAAMTSGTNNQDQTAFERYGEFRPIASLSPNLFQPLAIWGYGVDSQCAVSQVQQTSLGTVTSISQTLFRHDVDATFGNSGSGIIQNGAILGIATHCPCPNYATRVDHPNFANAREQFCPAPPPCPWDLDDSGVIDTVDLLALFAQWGTDGSADFDDSGSVDTVDLLTLFANWGPCK